MRNRNTRSNRHEELVGYNLEELARLERENRRTARMAAQERIILIPGEDGVLRDPAGLRYNAEGQRINDDGIVIVEEIVEPVDEGAVFENQAGVARHHNGVARHPHGIHAEQQGNQIAGRNRQPGVDRRPVQNRTLADFNRPDQFYANRAAIRPPAFQRNDFELKPAYYSLVAQHPFHGLPHEHPMDHIENFEDLASSIKAQGVSSDYLFCKLFPYSLSGDASYWLKQLEPGSLTTWEDTKNAFLNNFFDDARSEELRTKITSFKQGPTEAFKAAWTRLKSYQRDCPHHGFTDVQL